MKKYKVKNIKYPTVEEELNKNYKNEKYIKRYIREQISGGDIVINLFVLEIIINNFTNGSKEDLDGLIHIFYENFKDYSDISIFFKKIMKLDSLYSENITLNSKMIEEYLNGDNVMPLDWILMLGGENNFLRSE